MPILRRRFQLHCRVSTQSNRLHRDHHSNADLWFPFDDPHAIPDQPNQDGYPSLRQVPKPSVGQLLLRLLVPRRQAVPV